MLLDGQIRQVGCGIACVVTAKLVIKSQPMRSHVYLYLFLQVYSQTRHRNM